MTSVKAEKVFTNAYIGPWFAVIPETYQALTDIKDSFATNVVILKDYVKTNKPHFRNSVLDEYK